MTSLGVLETEGLPVQQLAQAFSTVTLVDTLSSGFGGEREQLAGELVDRFFDTLTSSVDNVTTVVLQYKLVSQK